MRVKVQERTIKIAMLIIENDFTIREIAKMFDVSRSTIHRDLKERLPEIDEELNKKIEQIMQRHLEQRYINSGNATKEKYRLLKDKSRR